MRTALMEETQQMILEYEVQMILLSRSPCELSTDFGCRSPRHFGHGSHDDALSA